MARVFISSRFGELGHLRVELTRRLRSIPGFEPVNLDDGHADIVGPLERSLASLDDVDIVVLLCADTYGAQDPTGISVTHAEYRTAVTKGLPVLAFARRPVARVPEMSSMLDEVMARHVVGELTSESHVIDERLDDDVDRVIDRLEEWAAASDLAGDDVASLAEQLMGEMRLLGADGIDTWTLPDVVALQSPRYVELVEQRRFALTYLRAGDITMAREELAAAHAKFSLDWCTNYLLARLLEAKHLRTDIAQARVHAAAAVLSVEHQAYAPMTHDDPAEALRRRKLAAWTMQARLARQTGDAAAATDAAGRALALSEHSRDAQVEAVLAHGISGDVASAVETALTLLGYYPDRAATLMRSPDLADVQPRVESALIDRVLEREARAYRALGRQAPVRRRRTRLRDAIRDLRCLHDEVRTELGLRVGAVLDLFERRQGFVECVPLTAAASLTRTAAEVDKLRAALLAATEAATALGDVDRHPATWPADLPGLPGASRWPVGDIARMARLNAYLAELGTYESTYGTRRGVKRLGHQASAEIAFIAARVESRRAALLVDVRSDLLRLESARPVEESSLADAMDRRAESHRRFLTACELLGTQPDDGMPAVAAALAAELRRYHAAFTGYPSLVTRDYVPRDRAAVGDVTRLDEEDRHGLLAGKGLKHRFARVVAPRRWSELALACAPSDAALAADVEPVLASLAR